MTDRPLDSGRKDALGRTIRVSGDVGEQRADAPAPASGSVTPTVLHGVEPCPDCGQAMVYGDDGYLHMKGPGGCWLGRNQRELTVEDHAGAAAGFYGQAVAENGTKDVVLAAIDAGDWSEIAGEVLEHYEHLVGEDADLDGLAGGEGRFADIVFGMQERVRAAVVDGMTLADMGYEPDDAGDDDDSDDDGGGDGAWTWTHQSRHDGSPARQIVGNLFENENGDRFEVDLAEWERTAPVTRTADVYEAAQCPDCKVWIYTAGGPFAEGGDRTKPLADAEHWETEHATDEERSGAVFGFPYFFANDKPVEAVVLPSSSAYPKDV